MFNIGSFEVLLICVIALLVLGPERLPGAIRTAGLWIGRFRRSFYKVKSEIERELNADEVRQRLHNESILADLEAAKESVEGAARETQASIDEIVKSGDVDPGVSPYTDGHKATSDAESPAVQPKTIVEEINSVGEELELAGKEIKESLYGLGKNPKTASDKKSKDIDLSDSRESGEAP